jgi:acylphosphatase
VKEKADQLGIKGWVRNEEDGTVKIVAEGRGGVLEKFIEWCKKGSPLARVDKVDVKWCHRIASEPPKDKKSISGDFKIK